MPGRLRMAMGFLTILPVGGAANVREEDIARSTGAFTLVGLLEGALFAGAHLAAGALFPPLLAATVAVACYLVLTGGLHIDGLADTCDALAARGDRGRRLAAMKDPATGPIGAAAVALALMIKVFAVAALGEMEPAIHYGALIMTPAIGKWCMIGLLRAGRPARPEGLGKLFAGRVGTGDLVAAIMPLSIAAGALAIVVPPIAMPGTLVFAAGSIAATFALGALLARYCGRAFGGITGDTAGAAGEAAELLYMMAVLAWLRLSI